MKYQAWKTNRDLSDAYQALSADVNRLVQKAGSGEPFTQEEQEEVKKLQDTVDLYFQAFSILTDKLVKLKQEDTKK